MKRIALLLVLAAASSFNPVKSQVVNRGAAITVAPGGILYVDGDFNNQTGSILNDGILVVKGNWQNNDPAFPAFSKQSFGVVEFSGNEQRIFGAFKTEFPSLLLSGNGAKILEVNADVAGVLSLNDREFRTGQFTLSMLNSSPMAITRSSGFISTDANGKLLRLINSASSYLFPLGTSASGQAFYRPLEVEMTDAVQNYFAVSFTKNDPTTGGYNRQNKRQDIKEVFDQYYYLLDQNGSSKLNIRFYQNTSQDANLKQLVNWNTFNIWEKAGPSSVNTGTFGDGLDQNLLFASDRVIDNLPVTLASTIDESPFTFFNAFTPDNDGKNDTWEVKNLDLYPDNDLTVFNRWGDEVFAAKGYSSAKAWDGGNLNPGTYYYILNVNMAGARRSFKGFITMVKKD